MSTTMGYKGVKERIRVKEGEKQQEEVQWRRKGDGKNEDKVRTLRTRRETAKHSSHGVFTFLNIRICIIQAKIERFTPKRTYLITIGLALLVVGS